jgi:hypothetical protein
MAFLFFITVVVFMLINVFVRILHLDPSKYASWLPYPAINWGPGWEAAGAGGWLFWTWFSWFAGWSFAIYHYWQNPWHKWFGHTKGSIFALILVGVWAAIWVSVLFSIAPFVIPPKYVGLEWIVFYSMGWAGVNWEFILPFGFDWPA